MKKIVVLMFGIFSICVSSFAETSDNTRMVETTSQYKEECGGVRYTVYYDESGWDVYVIFFNNNNFDVDVYYKIYGRAVGIHQPSRCLIDSHNSIEPKGQIKVVIPQYSAVKGSASVDFQAYRYY